jgi:hypothetical protein
MEEPVLVAPVGSPTLPGWSVLFMPCWNLNYCGYEQGENYRSATEGCVDADGRFATAYGYNLP